MHSSIILCLFMLFCFLLFMQVLIKFIEICFFVLDLDFLINCLIIIYHFGLTTELSDYLYIHCLIFQDEFLKWFTQNYEKYDINYKLYQ